MKRLPLFDSLRGTAMLVMAVYHFCFDLNEFGLIHHDMYHDIRWTTFRAAIASSFTLLVGVGLYLGGASYSSKPYWIRIAKIAGCAGLVSIATYLMFGSTWVFFGILHLIAVACLLGPLLIRKPRATLIAGAVVITLPLVYRNLWFHRPGFIITGLSPWLPYTEDFAPLAPWLGVVMIGVFIGYLAKQQTAEQPAPEATTETTPERWQDVKSITQKEIALLSRFGQHSLAFYMTHQLVLYPLAWLISKLA